MKNANIRSAEIVKYKKGLALDADDMVSIQDNPSEQTPPRIIPVM